MKMTKNYHYNCDPAVYNYNNNIDKAVWYITHNFDYKNIPDSKIQEIADYYNVNWIQVADKL